MKTASLLALALLIGFALGSGTSGMLLAQVDTSTLRLLIADSILVLWAGVFLVVGLGMAALSHGVRVGVKTLEKAKKLVSTD